MPQAIARTCVARLIRPSPEFVSWKDRKPVAPAPRAIRRAKDAGAGRKVLEDFDASFRGGKDSAIAPGWRRAREHVVPFFAFPESGRRIICATSAIEALNARLRRAARTSGRFTDGDAAMKPHISF